MSNLKAPSLAQYFDAPKDYTGHFGWICGYSADSAFLNDATERFTRLTSSQRAYQGRISLALFLDPGNPKISLRDAPGVAHLPIKDIAAKPFRLLHAKVAILGFKHTKNSDKWLIRLIVSTGNWTRQTLEESLDLAWCVEVDSESLNTDLESVSNSCTDIKAAHEFMMWIKELFDMRLLGTTTKGSVNESNYVMQQVDQWVATCVKKAKGEKRFIDSRKSALIAQLAYQIKLCVKKIDRNYLAMGSGFYEGAVESENPPIVPMEIIKELKKEGLLKKNTTVDLFVNADACQSIASSVDALSKHKITVRPAAQPLSVFGNAKQRTLHAKFLFSANEVTNSLKCNNAWIYLGSGNLTNPGFMNKMSPSSGNLEAGVVFAPDTLYWYEDKDENSRNVVTNFLPIQREEKFCNNSNQLSSGSEMEPREVMYVAPPIAWLEWKECNDVYELQPNETCPSEFVVIGSDAKECEKTSTGFRWLTAQPRYVRCCWIADGKPVEADIPVIDQFGRIAATELPRISIDEAWWQLADFPLPPDDGDGSDGGDDGDCGDGGHGEDIKSKAMSTPEKISNYPIRQMMDLIESIAAKQTEIGEVDWALWCNRLEQTLNQASASTTVMAFQKLGINPLSPLRHTPFRPTYAEGNESPAGVLYEKVLDGVEMAWAVNNLNSLGGPL